MSRVPPETSSRRGERGFALVVVIWLVGIVAMLTLTFGEVVRAHLNSTGALSDSARAEALADGGVALVALDIVAAAGSQERQRRFPLDTRMSAHCRLGDGELWIRVSDVGGLVDINTGSDRLLTALLLGLGLDTDQAKSTAAAILDYRDTDNTVRPGGAEKDEYLAAGRPAGPKNAPFDSISELEQVLGMSKPMVKRLSPYLTINSQQTGIDEKSASPELLDILQQGARLLPFEFGAGSSEPSTGAIEGILPASLKAVSTRRAFSIHIDAHVARGWFAREAVVTINTGSARPFRIVSWQHVATSTAAVRSSVPFSGNCMDQPESR